MNIESIKAQTKAMLELEKYVPGMERKRSRLLEEVKAGNKDAIDELERDVLYLENLRHALDGLILAMNNSAETFQKFERKAAKDRLTLQEAKKGIGQARFDDKDPILNAQRQALTRSIQKLDFLITELGKLRETLNHKYAGRALPEVIQLNKALRADSANWDDESTILGLRKSLSNALEMHHLPS